MNYQNLVIWPVNIDDTVKNIVKHLEAENWQQAKGLLIEYLATSPSQPLLNAGLYNSLGVVYQHLGLHNLALQNYREAENIANQLKNNLFRGIISYNIGYMFFAESRWGEAMSHLKDAVNFLRSAHKFDFEAIAQNLLNDVHAAYNHSDKFLQAYAQKVDLQPSEKIAKLREIAGIYAMNGSLNEAVDALNAAIDICESEGFLDIECIVLNDLAIIYKDYGFHDRAENALQKALEKTVELNNRSLQITSLSNYGVLLKEVSRFEEAIALFEQALAIRQELQETAKMGIILYNLASTYHAQGNEHIAIQYAERALEVDTVYDYKSVGNDKKLIKDIERKMKENR